MSGAISKRSYDVVIVGARCAGAATALLLARQGLSVLAIDRAAYGSDTISTHALMRGGVLQLRRWGIIDNVRAAGTPPVRTVAFHYGDEVVEIPIEDRNGVDALYAPRRTTLDPLLVDAARGAGAEIVHGVRFQDILRSSAGRVCGVIVEDGSGHTVELATNLLVGADGRTSRVARLTRSARHTSGRHTSGLVFGYWAGLDSRGYHWYYRRGISAGAIETDDGLTCVFAAAPERRFREETRRNLSAGHRRILDEIEPALSQAVAASRLACPLRAFIGEPGFLRESWGAGWALVGDAAYFRDPLTAHGITDALRDAELLARAVSVGTDEAFREYQSAKDDLSRELLRLSDEIAGFEWDLPTVRNYHHLMSREMNREVAWLNRLDRPATAMTT